MQLYSLGFRNSITEHEGTKVLQSFHIRIKDRKPNNNKNNNSLSHDPPRAQSVVIRYMQLYMY